MGRTLRSYVVSVACDLHVASLARAIVANNRSFAVVHVQILDHCLLVPHSVSFCLLSLIFYHPFHTLLCTGEPLVDLYSLEMTEVVFFAPAKNAIFHFFDCLTQIFYLAPSVEIAGCMGNRLIAPLPDVHVFVLLH